MVIGNKISLSSLPFLKYIKAQSRSSFAVVFNNVTLQFWPHRTKLHFKIVLHLGPYIVRGPDAFGWFLFYEKNLMRNFLV